jgi:hypothetical protein
MTQVQVMRWTAGALLGLGLVMAQVPAQAQEGPSGLAGIFASLLGGGSSAPEIDYRERAPLVVPPKSTLPPPQDREAARARANWPTDPDKRRRAAAEDDGVLGYLFSEKGRNNDDNVGRLRLSPDELARVRSAGPAQVTGPLGGQGSILDDRTSGSAMMYDPMRQIREQDARAKQLANERPIGAEPPRRYLSEPPVGYRAATQRVEPPKTGPIFSERDKELGINDFNRQNARQ